MESGTDIPPSLGMRAVRSAWEDAGGEKVDPEDAVRALRLALHAARSTLPDLQADGCSCGRLVAAPLVELGNVRPDVALRLAEVVSQGAMNAAVREANARSRGERL